MCDKQNKEWEEANVMEIHIGFFGAEKGTHAFLYWLTKKTTKKLEKLNY